jgi:hypothetical protein
MFSSVPSGNIKNLVVSITSKEGFSLYNSPNAYANMYLKTLNSELYDILVSSSTAVSDKLNISVDATIPRQLQLFVN